LNGGSISLSLYLSNGLTFTEHVVVAEYFLTRTQLIATDELFGTALIRLPYYCPIMLPQLLRILGPLVLRNLGSKALAGGPTGAIIQEKAAEILGVIAAATGVAAICLSWIPILNILSLIPAVLAIAAGGYALYVGRRHRFKRSWAFAGVVAGIIAFVIIFYSNDWLIGKFKGNDNSKPNTEEVRTTI
jgi:hypothetical protein